MAEYQDIRRPQRRINQGARGGTCPTQDMKRKNYPKYRGNFCLLEIIFIIKSRFMFVSTLSRKRAFNGSTEVIGYADSEYDIVNDMR